MKHDRFVPLELFPTELANNRPLIEHFSIREGVGARDVMCGTRTSLERSSGMLLSALDRGKENSTARALISLSDCPHWIAELVHIEPVHPNLRGGTSEGTWSPILEKAFTSDLGTLRGSRVVERKVLRVLSIRGGVRNGRPPMHLRPHQQMP